MLISFLANSLISSVILGYSYLPGTVQWQPWKDGVVVDYRLFGTIGVSAAGNDGRTPTHEVGHYLGLLHTFCPEDQNGNPPTCDDCDDNNALAFPGGVERANIVSLKLTINILQINRSSQQVHTFKSCDHVIWIVFRLMVRFF